MSLRKISTQKQNHPKLGDTIRVGPIREKKDVQAIKQLLAGHPRNLALFTTGINTNLRPSDLLRIPLASIKDLKLGDSFELREKKTAKIRRVTINKASHKAIRDYLKVRPKTKDEAPLFVAEVRPYKALSVNYLHHLVKQWCELINLKGNYGAHSLRKTFGYHHRVYFGTDIPTLMIAFNHSTQRQTLGYLGIESSDVHQAFLQEI
jgi:integrase